MRDGLADALFSKVKQRVLGALYGNPGRSYYANEIIALAESGTGAVQRELTRLAEAGLVTVTRVGKQKHYQANAAAPVYEELRGLVLKTSGLVRDKILRSYERLDEQDPKDPGKGSRRPLGCQPGIR